jgi:MerR family transcriptional regulator, light-induced transcriptional regulator
MTRIDLVASGGPALMRSYRIGDVARFVGVSTHALRAWERRYGTVEPHRTPGGSRLYDAAQIERLKTLKDLTNFGHSIGEVARMPLPDLKRLLAATLELSQSR